MATTLQPPVMQVHITDASAQPGAWRIAYEACNASGQTLWLVDEPALTLHEAPGRMELSHARAPLQPGSLPFGYFNPHCVPLAGGDCLRRHIDIHWPARLSTLWNAAREAAPRPGDYAVTVRVGYGETPAPDAPQAGEDVQDPVLRWQRQALSAPVTLAITPHAAAGTAGAAP
ncbi:MAG: hypothetical protein JSS31_02285 [Proteobacteria bacterium]|nr:hypothetical protein [Pseudomonadota bacterium]MBS0492778.1 hypothetical protein [Pseudomonadota bacterium]